MLPTLPAGTELLVNRTAYKNKPPQIGDIVVAQHPDQPKLKVIKRIAEVGETTVTILGDNPTESTDSRHYGAISRSLLLGKITSQWTPMKRRK